jgi:ribosomal protein L40E
MNVLQKHNVKPKKLKIILIAITAIFIVISIIGLALFSWFWIIIIPISFLLFAIFQAISDHLVEYHKICPKCNTKNNISSETCEKCRFTFQIYNKSEEKRFLP